MASATKYGLEKRGEAYYYDFWLGGQRYRASTEKSNYRDALAVTEAVRSAAKKAVADQHEVDRLYEGGEISFANAVTKYMNEKGNALAKASELIKHYAWIEEHLADGPETLLSRINNAAVSRLIGIYRAEPANKAHNRKREADEDSYKPQPKANSTTNRHLTQPLRQLMRWARLSWDCHVGAVNWRQHMLKEESETAIPRHAEIDEEEQIIAAMGNRGHEVCAKFLFASGCRVAEMIGLVWKRVNFKQRLIYVIGKGNKTRPIPMTQELYDLLWAQRGHHETYVFTFIAERTSKRAATVEGERYPMRMAGFNSHWKRALEKLGIEDFRIHDTRHTKGTRLLRQSKRLEVVKKLLGHASLKTTERYAHVLTDDVRDAMEAQEQNEAGERSPKSPPNEVLTYAKHLKLVQN